MKKQKHVIIIAFLALGLASLNGQESLENDTFNHEFNDGCPGNCKAGGVTICCVTAGGTSFYGYLP